MSAGEWMEDAKSGSRIDNEMLSIELDGSIIGGVIIYMLSLSALISFCPTLLISKRQPFRFPFSRSTLAGLIQHRQPVCTHDSQDTPKCNLPLAMLTQQSNLQLVQ